MVATDSARQTASAFARLAAFAAYAIALLAVNVMHFEGTTEIVAVLAAGVLWVVLASDYWRLLRSAMPRRPVVIASLGYPIYLVSMVGVTAHSPWALALPLIVGFVLQLRTLAGGHAATFALGLGVFVVVLATIGVVYAEQNEPQSRLRDFGAAATWSFARIIHLRGVNIGDPKSADGQALSFVIAIAGLLVASLLTAELLSWVIGRKQGSQPDNQSASRTADT